MAAPVSADVGPGDAFSTNCDSIARLAGQNPSLALLSLAGLLGGGSTSSGAATTSNQPPPTVKEPLPVTITTTANGGCSINVNPHI